MNKITGKSSVFKKISKKHYTTTGGIILAIGIMHFVLQISFIQNKNLQSVESAVENKVEIVPPAEQIITIEPEQVEVKKIKIITIPEVVKSEAVKPEIVKTAPRRQKEAAPVPKAVKKKEVRETRAERLRRAERILTGV